jgi:glycosyltransferase involved in cell wall biosynthesis
MRWLVLASSLSSTNGYGVLCGSVVSALHARNPGVELDIFTGDQKKGWKFGRRALRSERISDHPRLWWLFSALDLLVLLLGARGRHTGILVLVEHYSVAAWLLSRIRRIPFVVVQCGTYAVKLPRDVPFFHRVLRDAARVLPISRYTQKRMEEERIKARFHVVPLGVNLDRFHPQPVARQPRVVFVGNFKARKGFSFLLDALSVASARVPNVSLKVVGRINPASPEFRHYQNVIRERNLNVEFMGQVSDAELAALYAGARLNALPSMSEPFFFEGFGLIHLEANACGTLTVGTLDSGNEDAIASGLGYLVKYGDVEGLAGIIVEVMRLDPYPVLPVERLRTWNDVAGDYLQVMEESAAA